MASDSPRRLSIRSRVFWGSVALGTIPLTVALLVLAAQARSTTSAAGPRAALDAIAVSNGRLIAAVDTAALSPEARSTLRSHTEAITASTNLARRAETLTRAAATTLTLVILIAAVILVLFSLWFARRWAASVSRPVEELVQWARVIQQHQPLPADHLAAFSDPPEFLRLRSALRDMADDLERGRKEAAERERLVAFRETARRVAHEIRGPLTAIRLALDQLSERGTSWVVLRDETARLDRLAHEFSEFGRLPEGPAAPVDLAEMLEGILARGPSGRANLTLEASGRVMIEGRHEALRRTFDNLVRNALEASPPEAPVRIEVREEEDCATVRVIDRGAGIPADQRQHVIEPYVTTKPGGTGLGLAIAKQTVDAHAGTLTIEETPGGGTTVVVRLPI
jgi:signal transduction histidine kinase